MGNEAADRVAKWMALSKDNEPDDIDLLKYDMPYVLHLLGTPIHGDIRKEIKTAFMRDTWSKWASQPKRGTLAKEHGEQLQEQISINHKNLTSMDIKFMLIHYTKATLKIGMDWETPPCERCLSGLPNTVEHILTCSANEKRMKERDDEISTLLQGDTRPLTTTLGKATDELGKIVAKGLNKRWLNVEERTRLTHSILMHLRDIHRQQKGTKEEATQARHSEQKGGKEEEDYEEHCRKERRQEAIRLIDEHRREEDTAPPLTPRRNLRKLSGKEQPSSFRQASPRTPSGKWT
jgi:hypothetical protein